MKKQILLIDDDKDEMSLLCDALYQHGIVHSCTWASGVAHALKMLEFLKPHMILIDYNMPMADGLEGIASIRKMQRLADVPVILYSTTIDRVLDKASEAGATACIKKPTSEEDFKLMANTIGKLLNIPQPSFYE